VGGQWNYDQENRRPLPKEKEPPADLHFEPDAVTREIMAEAADWPPGVGESDSFGYAVTRQQALAVFDHFLQYRLADFGAYEDAMSARSHSLYHSLLSPYLNLGLLEPLELIRGAEQAYADGRAPLNSVEGFIRQILGWREFIYWQYWRQMPGMMQQNSWGAERPLPEFFWTGETEMACLRHALSRALATGYNHHIERLMLLSNFMMLAGINPAVANNWFLSVYIDAYDWVMPPNVIGMGLNADDGRTATKPYIASANYINKMSDHCAGCRFNHRTRHGADACPFNFLYWNFLLTHEERLRANPRLGRNVLGLRHLDDEERAAVRSQAADFLEGLA
jgi:deoxyribodipyrimidine photolyase-related protein